MVVNLPWAIIIKNNANIDISKTQCVPSLFKVHFYTYPYLRFYLVIMNKKIEWNLLSD